MSLQSIRTICAAALLAFPATLFATSASSPPPHSTAGAVGTNRFTSAQAPLPAGAAVGTATFSGQTLHFTHGLAWVDNDKFNVALFERTPREGILAELKSGAWGEEGPAALLSFMLDTGKMGAAGINYCFVNLTFPSGGPMSLNVNHAHECGLTEIGGELKPGGRIAARLQGSTSIDNRPPMTWDLHFNLPLSP